MALAFLFYNLFMFKGSSLKEKNTFFLYQISACLSLVNLLSSSNSSL